MLINMSEACEFLKECEDTVVLIHQSPDGDCTGAGIAVREILHAMGKRCRIECSDIIPKRYDFLTSVTGSGINDEFEPKTIIAVDVADPQLLGSLREKYDGKVQLCIDHHVSNVEYAAKTLLYPDASATCEIIYNMAKELGFKLSDHIATCIYTGIATDTGCFKYENTSAQCHEIVAELMKSHKLKYAKINREMFDVKSPGRIKMESTVMELMEFYYGNKLTMICVTADIMQKMGVDSNDLEGCASLPLQVEGAEVGIMIKEREKDVYKISMRSANDVNVSKICQTLGGGGHVKASGCLLKGSLDDVKKELIAAVGKAIEA